MTENPQKENGHMPLANEIVEALARTYLTSYETRILWVIFRQTYGWQKKEDWIAISQFVNMTGLHRSHVSRSIKLLTLRNIVTKRGNKIAFNKYWSQWKELPNGATNHSVTKRGSLVTKRGISELPNGAYTKDTLTKDTIQKTSSSTKKTPNAAVDAIISTMKTAFGELDDSRQKNRNYAWLLLKRAKMEVEPCLVLIRAAAKHDFWGQKITKVEHVYRNAHRIANDLREGNHITFIS